MKQSNLSFADGFNPNGPGQINRKLGKPLMAFDWDKAAEIIKEKLKLHPDLKAEAGLQGDWAKPTLILEWGGEEQEEIICETEGNERFGSDSKWDDKSLAILEIGL